MFGFKNVMAGGIRKFFTRISKISAKIFQNIIITSLLFRKDSSSPQFFYRVPYDRAVPGLRSPSNVFFFFFIRPFFLGFLFFY